MTGRETDNIKKLPEILIYGYGNPGRQDDAVGVLLAEKTGVWARENGFTHIATEQNYQLNIEDAELISNYDLVIFTDASVICPDDVLIEKVIPDLTTDFSMHSVQPSFVAGLAQKLFNKTPDIYQVHIKAIKFEFMEPVSPGACENLDKAFGLLKSFILDRVKESL